METKLKSWVDSILGSFHFNEYQWERSIRMEAFSVFHCSEASDVSIDASHSYVVLGIEADDESEVPSEEVMEVARLTIKNHRYLIDEALKALFDDFVGDGPGSEMWWHSAIDHVREIVVSRAVATDSIQLNNPEDLHALLGKPSIRAQEYGYGYDKPCTTICFEAVFEPEHGIGILTNGSEVLGVGYQMDVSPFN